MNVKGFLLASIMGLSAPTLANILITPLAIAYECSITGEFVNANWTVRIGYVEGDYTYEGISKNNGSSIRLGGATSSGGNGLCQMMWNNNGYSYRAIWDINDTGEIDLRVFNPNGQRILNESLYRTR